MKHAGKKSHVADITVYPAVWKIKEKKLPILL
jgi:hypothetical protein